MSGNAVATETRADSWNPTMDYHLIDCSGAQTEPGYRTTDR